MVVLAGLPYSYSVIMISEIKHKANDREETVTETYKHELQIKTKCSVMSFNEPETVLIYGSSNRYPRV